MAIILDTLSTTFYSRAIKI